jgi:streptogramin lyase
LADPPLVNKLPENIHPPVPVPVVVAPRFSPPIIVGEIGAAGANDGLGSQGRFNAPAAIAVDSAGSIFVADMGNDTIRRISSSGEVMTLAGAGGKAGEMDGERAGARFTAPIGIAVDTAGNVYVAEFANNIIRKINPEGSVSTLAGSPGFAGWKDARGDNAHFRNPWALAVDDTRNVYVADKDNSVIRKITPDGLVTTVAGQPHVAGLADGKGDAARFKEPEGIAVEHDGSIYVADTGNQAIRKISPAGEVKTILAGLINPTSMAVDAKGTVYFTDARGAHKIYKGNAELLPPLLLTASPDGPIAQANFIAVDGRGTVYLVDTSKNIVCWQPK